MVVIDSPVCRSIPMLDFGEVEPDQTATIPVRFSNFSEKPTTLEIGLLLAPFRSSVEGKRRLEVGESLDVSFSFTGRADALERKGDFTFSSRSGCEPTVVLMRGLSAGVIEVPTELDFGRIGLGQTSTRTITISSNRRSATTVLANTSGADGGNTFSVPAEIVIPPEASVDVSVVAHPSTPGSMESDLVFKGPANLTRRVRLRITGGVPRGVLSRTQIDMGIIPAPRRGLPTSVQHFFLHNVGDGPLEFQNRGFEIVPGPGSESDLWSTSDGATFGVVYPNWPGVPPPIAPGEKAAFGLNVFPNSTPGPRSWRVVVHTNSTPDLELEVVGRVVVMPACPSIHVSTGSFDAGQVAVGQSASFSVPITNLETHDCLIDLVPFFPTSAWSSSASGQTTLDAGGSMSLDFTFQPQDAGPDIQFFNVLVSGTLDPISYRLSGAGY